jgi:hypothetical protein
VKLSDCRFRKTAAGNVSAVNLVTVPSYEDRFLPSLDRACDVLQTKSVTFLLFTDYFGSPDAREVDPAAAALLRANYIEAQRRLKVRGVRFSVLEARLDDLNAFALTVQQMSWQSTAIDVSTMPRSYILTILRFAQPKVQTIVYTQGKNLREGEDAFTIGVRDVVTLPGFEGKVGHRPTLLVMSVGYEGARAYSLFRRYEPTVTLACLGDPGSRNKQRERILQTVRRNNASLLDTEGVWLCPLAACDPYSFAEQASKQIDDAVKRLEKLQGFPADVVLSPVGTKPQALGLFSIWCERPTYQIAYAIPTTRRLGTVGAGTTYWFSRPSK